MDKRILILLLVCSFLAVATVTIRYIEGEKEKIESRFVPLPKEKKVSIRRVTPAT